MKPLVCLLTDFGTSDEYVASMKGVLFTLCPRAIVVDITHELTPHDILGAAYLLYSTWDYFPRETVFVCVVDPGVGAKRTGLVACVDKKYVVCPDNGTLSLLMRMKGPFPCYNLQRAVVQAAGNKRISATFHGRDIFTPAAGLICNRKYKSVKGEKTAAYTLDQVFTQTNVDPPAEKGRILHIDRFGNCISGIHRSELTQKDYTGRVSVAARNIYISFISKTFADVAPGHTLAYWGSTGFLEIGIRNGSAAAGLGIAQLDEVVLR